ncbi:MAG: exopolygalacturonase [Bacteroidaceae bacterium]|nr:exopolygalacturonase [Bacteroidaceae bacterium]
MFFQPVCGRKKAEAPRDTFPDGTAIPAWFKDTTRVDISQLGRQYCLTDFGIRRESGGLCTEALQALIDRAANEGGGTIVIPPGVFCSGALFFRQGTHLHLQRGALLKGSTNIIDYPLMQTRIEGQTCMYFPALVNADSINGFTISGEGTIDGSGEPFWKAFWMRRKWNPSCTNKDEQRPRLLYISNCRNVRIEGVTLQNSPFWTSHYYRSENVKIMGVRISSPRGAPSTDAIDIDACRNVWITGCDISVDDDAVALKGGKGPWADDPAKMPENGANENVLVEDSHFGFCHSCLTCGSESIHNRNILMRRIRVGGAATLLWLKMRTDTPQLYEYITVEDIQGNAGNFLLARPWSQFANLEGRTTPPMSYADHITMRNITLRCNTFFNVGKQDDQYRLSHFTFENLDLEAKNPDFNPDYIDGVSLEKVRVNGTPIPSVRR